ncbi:MAG: hypothetical protein J1F16_03510 [Muribaculaceae bacterium]|nr:hypothetical protein [Muribaculaceae bacterium]
MNVDKINTLKSVLITLAGLILMSCGGDEHKGYDKEIKTLFDQVDEEINKSEVYQKEKEKRIERIRSAFRKESDNRDRMRLGYQLIEEYESFNSDSAIYYVNLNMQNPLVSGNQRRTNEMLIKKADITAHAGLFNEAEHLLASVNSSLLDSILLQKYYHAYCDLYQYKAEYNSEGEYLPEIEQLRSLYTDSVTSVSPPNSMPYIINEAGTLTRNGKTDEAEEMLKNKIKEFHSGERNYSILASLLAYVYKEKGDRENYIKYLGQSVISDIQGSVKENMAIRALATECFEEGDINRAERYLRQSFADANFYAARMRNAQSSRMLPVIGEAYAHEQKKLHHELSLFIIFISILAFGFILISVFALMQVVRVKRTNRKTEGMLEEVSRLSEKLTSVNEELSKANSDLTSSNALKEEYAVLFMEYCSLAISALHHYQQSLKVAAAQGNMNNLVKKIESANIESKTLSEFYSKFDEAILNLYPQFVENFNSLLRPEERISVKVKDGLNTELRVFALIRIGITDSEKIAKFLRCSVSTVYTYRSKMKKRALNPDTFEEDVDRI